MEIDHVFLNRLPVVGWNKLSTGRPGVLFRNFSLENYLGVKGA